MKEKSEEILEFQCIHSKLDKAIDKLDVPEIEKQLEKLSKCKPLPCEIEDSKLFAKRIIKQNKKGNENMRKSVKRFGTLAACIALTITVGVTAYATDLFKNFKFYNDKTTVEVRTDQNIDKEEAEKMAKAAQDDYNSPSKEENTVNATTNTFSSIKEVESNICVKIILPSYIPEDFQMRKDITVQNTFNDNHNIYTTYESKDKEDRLLEISIITKDQPKDSTVVTVTDTVHKGEYKTPSGTIYELLNEDEATIATVNINNIEYNLVFMGVDEKEMHKVIDSVDLSIYKK